MVILESSIHPRGRGNMMRRMTSTSSFARELAHLLEQEAQLDHFRSLTIFACGSFLGEIRHELGKRPSAASSAPTRWISPALA